MIDDRSRLEALYSTGLMDSEAEESFDRITAMVARLLEVPVALISLVDDHRQFFKACVGLAEPWATKRETPLSHSFCQHTITSRQPLIVEDAREHPLVRDNLAIPDLNVIAYAGIPLITSEGHALGTLCAIDSQPRKWTDDQISTLTQLAAFARTEIELRDDIHGRQQVEQALRESEARYRSLVESASDIIYGTDGNGFFTYANPIASQTFGYSDAQLIGMHFTQLVREAERAEVSQFYINQFRRKIDQTYYEFPATDASGREIWIGQNVRLVLENGRVAGSQAVARDITERHAMDRLKDELISIVSHELRTPLTSLRGSLGLLSSGRLSGEKMQRMLDIAVQDTDRLIRLINDFLDLERIRSHRTAIELREVELNAIIQSAVESVKPEANRLHVGIAIDLDDDAVVRIDPDRMVQVAVNLLSNAVKFSAPESTVRICARRENGSLLMEVVDQGRGIPAEKHALIFEPFQQVDASDSRDRGGTGLGLPIAKSIVEQHGGTIAVESAPGRGSKFTVTVPV